MKQIYFTLVLICWSLFFCCWLYSLTTLINDKDKEFSHLYKIQLMWLEIFGWKIKQLLTMMTKDALIYVVESTASLCGYLTINIISMFVKNVCFFSLARSTMMKFHYQHFFCALVFRQIEENNLAKKTFFSDSHILYICMESCLLVVSSGRTFYFGTNFLWMKKKKKKIKYSTMMTPIVRDKFFFKYKLFASVFCFKHHHLHHHLKHCN